MTIVRWEPLREFGTLQNEMNRLFNAVFDAPATGGNGGTLRRWMPAMSSSPATTSSCGPTSPA
jgi:HSP20 family protein